MGTRSFLSGKLLYFFLGLRDYSDKFPKMEKEKLLKEHFHLGYPYLLEEKYKKISVLLQQLTYEINAKIYILQEPKKSVPAVALLQN